jgi:hypothetical protein
VTKRAPLLIVIIAIVGVAGGLLWMSDSDSGRTGRQGDAANGRGGASTATEPSAAPDEGAIADAATLAKLIERHGGFETRGRTFLTRPTVPGENLEILLKAELDGHRIEGRAKSDAEGRFAIHRLPRGTDYRLTVEGERVQTMREDLPEPPGAEVDLGDLYLDRLYYLTGMVVSGSGIAVSQAEVAVVQPNGGGGMGFSWRSRMESAGQADPVIAKTLTGADGKFTLELKDPGIFYVRARAKDWAPHYRDNVFIGAGADTEVKIALTRGVEIGGIVLDATGRPLPGAAVSLFPNSRNWMSQVKELQKTDADGRFEFRIEPRTDRYQMMVSPQDGVDVNKQFTLPLNEELVIQLPGGATLKGRVVDADTSQAIANADIIVSLRGPGANQWQGAYQKAITTDSYGVFRLVGVGTDGLHSLAVSARGYAHFVGSGWSRDAAWQQMSKLKFVAGQEANLGDIPLKRGRIVEGTVRDADTQEPIPGATVTLQDWILGNKDFKTGAEGRYRVEDIGDRVSLSAKAPGYIDERTGGWGGQPLEPGQDVVTMDFELRLAGTVSGTVKTSTGEPVARALVRLRSAAQGRGAWMGEMRLREYYTHTDAEGKFVIEGVPPVDLKAEASTPGFNAGESEAKKLEPGMKLDDLHIKLVNSATVTGVVVSRGGGMVANARVTIAKKAGDDMGSRWRALAGGTTVFTDDKGRFTAEDVPVGDIMMRVEAEEHAIQTTYKNGVKPGETVTGIKVTLKPALTITGKLLDEKGEPMTMAWVRARQISAADGEPSSQLLGARVQQDGTFSVNNIAEGTYSLEVQTWNRGGGTQYEPLKRDGVVAGTKDIVLRMKVREQ